MLHILNIVLVDWFKFKVNCKWNNRPVQQPEFTVSIKNKRIRGKMKLYEASKQYMLNKLTRLIHFVIFLNIGDGWTGFVLACAVMGTPKQWRSLPTQQLASSPTSISVCACNMPRKRHRRNTLPCRKCMLHTRRAKSSSIFRRSWWR